MRTVFWQILSRHIVNTITTSNFAGMVQVRVPRPVAVVGRLCSAPNGHLYLTKWKFTVLDQKCGSTKKVEVRFRSRARYDRSSSLGRSKVGGSKYRKNRTDAYPSQRVELISARNYENKSVIKNFDKSAARNIFGPLRVNSIRRFFPNFRFLERSLFFVDFCLEQECNECDINF